jgi:hypothetical protein
MADYGRCLLTCWTSFVRTRMTGPARACVVAGRMGVTHQTFCCLSPSQFAWRYTCFRRVGGLLGGCLDDGITSLRLHLTVPTALYRRPRSSPCSFRLRCHCGIWSSILSWHRNPGEHVFWRTRVYLRLSATVALALGLLSLPSGLVPGAVRSARLSSGRSLAAGIWHLCITNLIRTTVLFFAFGPDVSKS